VPVIRNDFYPTLLQLVGLPLMPSQHTGGISITPLLQNKTIVRDALYWHYPHYGNQGGSPGSAIRMGDWKLIKWYEDNRIELFNLKADLGEKNNIAEQNPEVKARLLTMLHDWLKKENASMPTINKNIPAPQISLQPLVDTNYLSAMRIELTKKWPGNRLYNLVFHGHSVVAGYFNTPKINTFQSYPMVVLKKLTEKQEKLHGKKFFLAHGDDLSEKDKGYQLIKKFFNNKLAQWAFAKIHPELSFRLAGRWSKNSRLSRGKKLGFLGENKEDQIIFAKELLRDRQIDYFVFGHRHLALEFALSPQSKLFMLGDWFDDITYGVFDGNNFYLENLPRE